MINDLIEYKQILQELIVDKERKSDLLRIAHKMSVLLKEEWNKLPYGANLIEELHAGENAHSRILRMLLQYRCEGDYLVYSSFLGLIKRNCPNVPASICCRRPEFVNEEGRIDVLIKEYAVQEKFGIIIENKVCDAIDQEKQIQRYIEKVESDGVPTKNIFVIYLTKDGEKEVSQNSLTSQAKEKLEMSQSSWGRFIRLNYRDHILPWLENDILPKIPIKEELLISSIRLYIDYLKGLFGKNDFIVYNKIRNNMKEELNIKTICDYIKVYNEIDFLYDEITKGIIEEANKVLEDHFYIPLNTFLNSNYEYEFEYAGKGNNNICFWFDIVVKNWEKTKIRFTYESSIGQYYGISYKNERNKVGDDVVNGLKERFNCGKSSNWWPWYNTLKTSIESSNTVEIWKDIENGRLLKFVKEWISDVIALTKDFDM